MDTTNTDFEIEFNVSRQWILAGLFFAFSMLFAAAQNMTKNVFLVVVLLMLSAYFFFILYRYYSKPVISISAGKITIRDIFSKTVLDLSDVKVGHGSWFLGVNISAKSKKTVLPTKMLSHSSYKQLLGLISKNK